MRAVVVVASASRYLRYWLNWHLRDTTARRVLPAHVARAIGDDTILVPPEVSVPELPLREVAERAKSGVARVGGQLNEG